MAQLVADDVAALVTVEQRQHAGVEHDEGLVEAHGRRVDERRLRNVELRLLLPVHRIEDFLVQRVELRTLRRAYANSVGQEQLTDTLLAEESGDLANHLVKARQCTQRVQS